MKLYTFHRRQKIRRPLTEIFGFFSTPENLKVLTPENLGLQILTPSPIEMKEGALIDYAIKVAGIPVRWTTVITEYDPPFRFVDVQLRGPYSYWHHAHSFMSADDETIMADEIHYALPFGVFGRLAHAFFVGRQLRTIFSVRARRIDELFSPSNEVLHTSGDHPLEGKPR